MFCGAGIGAVGAKQAGFKSIWAFDFNKYAVQTYNKNIENVAFIQNANTLDFDSLGDVDVVTAGFPCQPFSFSGLGLGIQDPKSGNLGRMTCDFLMYTKPKTFMLENVKGIISKKNKPFFNSLIDFLSIEYNITWKMINCADYGVPQKRERVFVVGIHKSLYIIFNFPKETHKNNHVSIRDAIEDIKIKGDYISNHSVDCGLRTDEKPYADLIPHGKHWRSLPIIDQKIYMKGAFNSSGGRTGGLQKMDLDKPAKTILSSPMGKMTAQLLQWDNNPTRRYTVRESLRLQSVPDWFYFDENIPLYKQYERVSGIPSLVERIIMTELKNILSFI